MFWHRYRRSFNLSNRPERTASASRTMLAGPPCGLVFLCLELVLCGSAINAHAQQVHQYTAEDYLHAERWMSYHVDSLSSGGLIQTHWLQDGRLWYTTEDTGGIVYHLVDPARRTVTTPFSIAHLARALDKAGAPTYLRDPHTLRLANFTLTQSDSQLSFVAGKVYYQCGLSADQVDCTATQTAAQDIVTALHLSPDRTKALFIRDWNLWLYDLLTATQTPLTSDGISDFGYSTDNAGWRRSDNAIVLWSPDSRKIATFRQDQRSTGEMTIVPITNKHPQPDTWKYPLAGDDHITTIQRVIVELPAAGAPTRVIPLKMPADQHRSTLCDDITCHEAVLEDAQWSADSSELAFVSTSRDHKDEVFRVANATTGEVRTVLTESVPTYFGGGDSGRQNWRYLSASHELIWFSERDNWGNLYLYDTLTGQLKNKITGAGLRHEGSVTQLLKVDLDLRTLYFLGVGREPGRDPYLQHLYSIRFDGTEEHLLTPENSDHVVEPASDGRYFLDTHSTPVSPRRTVLRDLTGKIIMDLAHQDIAPLLAAGWRAPTPIVVKGRDGKTPVYGLMFTPFQMEPGRKYPVIDHVYPGPQTGSCGSREFRAARGDSQALAELGFVVVCLDGMGTPWRSKAFHDVNYADLGDNTIPDQVAGLQDLARQFPFINLARVGIYGHSAGGTATVAAMFHYPGFFPVGVAESGVHDQRGYEDDWAEKWSGLDRPNPDGTSSYDSQANQYQAGNLKGHLLLIHGTMDENVPFYQTLLVVNELIKANKDFDLIFVPNVGHNYGAATPYVTRRRWDYFVRYLAGAVPPPEYQMTSFGKIIEAIGHGSGPNPANDSLPQDYGAQW